MKMTEEEKYSKKLVSMIAKAEARGRDISSIKEECLTVEWFIKNYSTTEKTKITRICPIHGEFEQAISLFIKGYNCRKCANAKNSQLADRSNTNGKNNGGQKIPYEEAVLRLSPGIQLLEESYNREYKNQNSDITLICPKHGKFIKKHKSIHNKCPECVSEEKRISFKNIQEIVEKLGREDYDYSLITQEWFDSLEKPVIRENFKVPIIHKECGETFFQNLNNHFNSKQKCSHCNPHKYTLKNIKDNIEAVKDRPYSENIIIEDINEEWYNNYKGYYDTTIKVTCKIHGDISSDISSFIKRQTGCPKCSAAARESLGEAKVRQCLEDLNVSFEQEYKMFKNPVTGRWLPFDFYLKDLNAVIEFDGIQHFKATAKEYMFTEEDLKIVQFRDSLKNEYLKNTNIKLLRIAYYDVDKIEELISEFLKSL